MFDVKFALLLFISGVALYTFHIVACNESTTIPASTSTDVLTTRVPSGQKPVTNDEDAHIGQCPSGVVCSKLGGECINCHFDHHCQYGQNVSVTCWPKSKIVCEGPQQFTRWYHCEYCYQTAEMHHWCTLRDNCLTRHSPRQRYQANCTVSTEIICLGRRNFHKMLYCNWTSGKRWSTALALSVTLGGFGADRFYLGLWREGIGKLFSFGGLGVWTIVDVVLVATGYIGPADGSLYLA